MTLFICTNFRHIFNLAHKSTESHAVKRASILFRFQHFIADDFSIKSYSSLFGIHTHTNSHHGCMNESKLAFFKSYRKKFGLVFGARAFPYTTFLWWNAIGSIYFHCFSNVSAIWRWFCENKFNSNQIQILQWKITISDVFRLIESFRRREFCFFRRNWQNNDIHNKSSHAKLFPFSIWTQFRRNYNSVSLCPKFSQQICYFWEGLIFHFRLIVWLTLNIIFLQKL